MNKYHSIYGSLIERYVNFKRNLGYKFVDAESIYRLLDKFAIQRDEKTIKITQEFANVWSQQRPNESESTRYKRVMYLIHFSQYLNDLGYKSFVPPYPSSYKSTFIPYIFTEKQMNGFFTACDSMVAKNSDSRTHVVVLPALFRMMYGTGIRVGETVALLRNDVDLENGTLIIRDSKNGKERMIPFSESVAQACRDYRFRLTKRAALSEYFFVRHNGLPCNKKCLYNWFRKVIQLVGISHGGRGNGPRLHEFRHAFCIHSLAKMAGNGIDLYYSLPILSEYLGHQSLEATEKYVRLTAEMYPGLISEVNNICSYAFPDIYEDD